MKRFMRKQNPAARLVALWMVFLMLLTPLLEHGGMPEKVKAAGEETTALFDRNVDLNDDAKIECITDTDGNITSAELEVTVNKANVFTLSDGIKFNIIGLYGDVTYNGKKYSTIDSDIKLFVGTELEASAQRASDASNWLEKTATIKKDDLETDKKIYVYAKINSVSDISDTIDLSSAVTDYTKVAEYTVGSMDYIAKWQNSGADTQDDKYYNSAKLAYNPGGSYLSSDIFLDKMIGLSKDSDTEPTAADWIPAVAANSIEINTTGTYYGYVAVVSNEGTIVKTYQADVVNIDADAPKPHDVEFLAGKQGSGYQDKLVPDSVGRIYVDKIAAASTSGKSYIMIPFDEANPVTNSDNISELKVRIGENEKSVVLSTYNNKNCYVVEDVFKDLTLIENTDYEVKAYLKDKAGNIYNDKLFTMRLIDKATTVTYSITGDGYNSQELPAEASQQIGNKELTLNATITSGTQITEVELSGTGFSNYIVPVADLPTTPVNGIYTYNFEYKFTDEVEYKDVKLSVTAGETKAVNIAGVYKYDKTIPDIEYKGIYQKNDNGTYKDISGSLSEGNYYVDDTPVYFIFDASDSNGIKSVKVENNKGKIVSANLESVKIGADNVTSYYVAKIDKPSEYVTTNGEVAGGETVNKVTLKAYSEDNATNKSNEVSLPNMVEPYKDLIVEALLYNKADQIVDLSANENTNEQYKLLITASSGYAISSVKLSCNGVDKYAYTTFDTTSYDEVTKRYTVTKAITLPESVDKNDILTNMAVLVTDAGNASVSSAVGTLLFDQTKPVVKFTDTNGYSIGAEWYGPTFTGIKASITSGNQPPESPIDGTTVKYNISGAADETKNDNDLTDGVNTSTTPVTVTISGEDIPESDDVNGTIITINAKDEAGNLLETGNTVTIKMDKTSPTLTEVLVNGDEYDKYTDKYPKIKVKVTAEDSLTLSEIGYKLEKWNGSAYVDAGLEGTSTTYIDATGNNNAKATKEIDICGYNDAPLEDGKYKVIVYAKDKAGNIGKKEIEIEVNGELDEKHTLYVINDDTSSSALTEKMFGNGTDPLVDSNRHAVIASFTSSKKIVSAEIYAVGADGTQNKLNEDEDVKISATAGEMGLYYGEIKYTFGDGDGATYENIYLIVKDTGSQDTDPNSYLKIDLGSFVYDSKAPKVTCKGLYVSSDDTTWTKIDKKAYTIDTTKIQKYRYVFDVEETTSGVKEAKIYYGADLSVSLTKDASGVDGALSFSGDSYYVEFNTTDISDHINNINGYGTNTNSGGRSLVYRVKVEDNAGNVSSDAQGNMQGIEPSVKLSNNKLRATALLQYKDTDVSVDVSDPDTTYINRACELTVTATSAYKIKTMELTSSGALYNANSYTVTDEDNANGYNSDTKLYTVAHVFDIPADATVTVNELINSLGIKVVDNNTDTNKNTYTASVGTLLYDQTEPIIVNGYDKFGNTISSIANDSPVDPFVDDTKWYKSYTINATIKSGEQTVESDITEAGYSISNGVDSIDPVDLQEKIKDGKAVVKDLNVPMSNAATGTTITFTAKDKAGNPFVKTLNIRVDSEAPSLDITINNSSDYLKPVSGDVKLAFVASDNLALSEIDVLVTKKDGTVVGDRTYSYGDLEALKDTSAGISLTEILDLKLTDGNYTLVAYAKDKAGNSSSTKTISFIVDGTVPVVTAKVASGTMGGKKPLTNFDGTACDYYYRSDVTVQLTYDDDNMDSKDVKVTHNGSPITVSWSKDSTGKYIANYPVSSNGTHIFNISATDRAGNPATPKSITFVKDSVAPQLSAIVNGGIVISDTTGQLMLTSDTTVALSVSDANEDAGDLNYQTIKNVPDQPVMTSSYLKTTNRSFNFAEEADYTFNAYSVDMAGNQSAVKTVSFRLDKTAPNISVGGIGANGTSSNPVTLSFNMQELFWRDASGSVRIYRKAGDGSVESLMEEFDYTPTAYQSSIARNISESGIYRVEFEAQDRVGHNATTEMQFTIDVSAPQVTLTGVENYDVTDQSVTIESVITDEFFASKRVSVTGSVTDATGKVTPITITDFDAAVNPTTINKVFSDDGIYDLTITATDVAGNSTSQSVHFTIDKSAPVIGDLSAYDGAVLTEFVWDIDLDELVSDLTVCDVHMYLNGTEYDGEEEIADGSYVLLITAEDDLGHKVEKSVEFVLDTKAPVFIVTGVEDEEVKDEPYEISVSLQLEEDTLTSVTLNGKVITITDNIANISVTEKGNYTLVMTAVDEAGNEVSDTIEFRLGQETDSWLWLILVIIAVLLVLVIIFIIIKRRKDSDRI